MLIASPIYVIIILVLRKNVKEFLWGGIKKPAKRATDLLCRINVEAPTMLYPLSAQGSVFEPNLKTHAAPGIYTDGRRFIRLIVKL